MANSIVKEPRFWINYIEFFNKSGYLIMMR